MAEIAFYVEIEVDPTRRGAFDDLMDRHARGTLAEEEGCLAFHVYVDRNDPDRYALYELYADEAALEVHRTSVRLGRFRRATDAMVLERRIWTVGDEMDVSHFPGAES